jgi:hypothetical protein
MRPWSNQQQQHGLLILPWRINLDLSLLWFCELCHHLLAYALQPSFLGLDRLDQEMLGLWKDPNYLVGHG